MESEQQYTDPLAASTWSAANVSPYPVVTYTYTGDYRIDTLLGGFDTRWNAGSPFGAPVTVTYSFMGSKPFYGGTDDGSNYGFVAFTSAQRAAVHQIFDQLQSELNIKFVEVADSNYAYGQIRFGNNYQSASSGYSWLAGSAGELSGDVWMDAATLSNLMPTPGNQGWDALVHEIGHALGLKHPGNYNAGTIAQSAPGNYLGSAEDNLNYTIMSYYDAPGGQPRDWYGEYDLLALKALYGANAAYKAGDTVYRYANSSGAALSIIDDASGNDTIDLSALSIGTTIDMRPGGFSSVGLKSSGAMAQGNLSIDLQTVVENLVGSAYNDIVQGNDANNRLTLGTGANTADGAGGIDTAVYAGTRAGYSAKVSYDGTLHVNGTNVSDSLTHVERVQFSDIKLAFDLSGAAGTVAKTIGAVFGSWAVGNASYEGIGLNLADGGMDAGGLMQVALNARLGAGASNQAVVDLLYTNVLGHAPTQAEAAPFVQMLDSGSLNQLNLGVIAANCDANCTRIDLVGLSTNGVAYV